METRQKKILVVDDDSIMQKVICDILKSAGYQTVLAGDAATAVKLVRKEQPDLITLDVVLGAESPMDMQNGFTVASWLNRLNPDKKYPVIIISGVDPNRIIQGAAAVDAYTFLPKPVEKAKLLAAVAGALQ